MGKVVRSTVFGESLVEIGATSWESDYKRVRNGVKEGEGEEEYLEAHLCLR